MKPKWVAETMELWEKRIVYLTFLISRTFDGETVVVKILSRNDKQAIREWDNEVQILQSLNNPHIVRYIGSGYDDRGFPMIVMEFGGDPFIPFFNRQLAEKTL